MKNNTAGLSKSLIKPFLWASMHITMSVLTQANPHRPPLNFSKAPSVQEPNHAVQIARMEIFDIFQLLTVTLIFFPDSLSLSFQIKFVTEEV